MDLFDLSAKLTLDTSEYSSALEGVKNSASSFADFIGGSLSTAVNTGVIAMTTFATAIGGVTAAMGSAISDTAAYGDNIDKASQKLGVSAEFYQEWDAVLQHSGTSMDSMSATFKKLATAVQDGSDDQIAAFEKLGLSMDDLSSMSTEQVFEATITALQGMEEGTERTALATELLGKGAMEMGALLNTSAEDTQAMIDTVHELGGVMSDDAVNAAARYQDSLQDMQTAMSGLQRNMASEFLPGVADVMDGLTQILSGDTDGGLATIEQGINNMVAKVQELIPKITEILTKLAPTIGDAIAMALPALVKSASQILLAIGKGILNNIPTLIDTTFTVIEEIGAGLLENLPTILDAGVEIILSLISGITEALPELLPAFTEAFVMIIMALTQPELLTSLVDAAIQLMIALTEGLVQAVPILIEALPQIMSNIVDALIQNAPAILEAILTVLSMIGQLFADLYGTYIQPALDSAKTAIAEKFTEIVNSAIDFLEGIPLWFEELPSKLAYGLGQAVGTLIQWVVDMATAAAEIAPQVIDAIVTFFSELPENIWTWLVEVVTSIGTWISDMATKIAESVPQVIDDFLNFFKELPDKLLTIGGQIVDGLWDGIKNGWDTFVENVVGLVDDFIQGIKDKLGIASPSKVFKVIGGFTAEGFGVGWDNEFSDVKDRIVDDLDFSGYAASIPALDSGDMESAYGNFNQTININQQIATPDELAREIRLESRYGLMRGVAIG